MFGGVFGGSAGPAATLSDLTGGVGLPMFAAAASRQDTSETPKKANKSLGYHESGSGGIARQGENDQ